MLKILNKIYNYKIENVDKNEIVKIRIGNLLSFLALSISIFYSFIYLLFFDSFSAFVITLTFAFSYSIYFYFLSKMEILKARFSFLLLILAQIFISTVFLISSKSGIQYYFLMLSPIAYLLINEKEKYRNLITILAFFLFLLSHFLGESYYIIDMSDFMLESMYILSLTILFIVFIAWFNVFIAEMKLKERKLEYASKTDYLTNILNRRAFYTKAEDLMKLSQRYGGDLGLLLFDIDYFKKINDKHGHNIGDRVLQALSKEVSFSIRETDSFARFGGEEFIIILPNITKEQLLFFADKIRKIVQNIEVKNDNNEIVKFTISLGITVYTEKDNIESFIARADAAMYESKEKGRNMVSAIFLEE